mmetsp:Transcript_10565/g.23275  ORF Transcript_10565/g.23275 Transcript_10565/m.23275 type:complete len:289 (+) Transcript_10565:490-1356(+)
MHHGTVLIPLDVGSETLVRIGPTHGADAVALHWPLVEPIEGVPQSLHPSRQAAVHECVAQAAACAEVHWQVDQVVEAIEAAFIEHLQEHLSGHLRWQVSQHHSSAPLLAIVAFAAVRGPARSRLRTRPLGAPALIWHAVGVIEIGTALHHHPLLIVKHHLLLDGGGIGASGGKHPIHVQASLRGIDAALRLVDGLEHWRLGPDWASQRRRLWAAERGDLWHGQPVARGVGRTQDRGGGEDLGVSEGAIAACTLVASIGIFHLQEGVLHDHLHLRLWIGRHLRHLTGYV